MSFFIRGKNKNLLRNGKIKRKNTFVAHPKQKKKKPKFTEDMEEEISSSDDENAVKDDFQDQHFVIDEEQHETAQEKKLKLAKIYLDEIEKEERERLQTEDVDDNLILKRLKEDVLREDGKLRKFVADSILSELPSDSIKVLHCKDHKLSITCVVVSTDSKYIYSGSKDGSIVKWSLPEQKRLKCIPSKYKNKTDPNLHSSAVLALSISYDGFHLASSDKDSIIRIWSGETLEFMFSFKGHRGSVTGLAFCRFTKHLYSCSHDKTIRVWSVPDKAYIESLFGHQAEITNIDVLSKDRAVSSGGIDNTVRIWKIEEESQLIFNGKLRHIDSVKRLNDKNFITCGEDGSICLWGIFKKKPIHTIMNAHGIDSNSGEPNWISSIATMQNTDVFASGSNDGIVRVWKIEQGLKSADVILEIPVIGFVNSIAFSPDENFLVLGVGQEHRLGRWSKINGSKNSVQIVSLQKKDDG